MATANQLGASLRRRKKVVFEECAGTHPEGTYNHSEASSSSSSCAPKGFYLAHKVKIFLSLLPFTLIRSPPFFFWRWTPRRKKKTFSFFFSILKKVQVKRLPSGPSTRHFVINPTPPALTTPTSQTTTFWRARKREQWPRECAWPNRRVILFWFFSKRENGAQAKFSPRDDAHKTLSKDGRHFCVVFLFLAGTRKKTCHKMEDVNQ